MMDPCTQNFAWPKHVIARVRELYLDSGLYDGVMFDCLAEGPFGFGTLPDLNGDQLNDGTDVSYFQQGMDYLLSQLRSLCDPGIILTGNGGVPWMTGCPYWENANGNMHENALGNEFGSDWWYGYFGANPPNTTGCYGVWDGYQAAMNAPNPLTLERCHFISVDLRQNRTQSEAETLNALTEDDLREMRLGLVTSMLMDGGYSGYDRGDCLHGQLWWFDEYDAVVGNPAGSCQTGIFGAETYSREFEYGIVVVNNNATSITVMLTGNHMDVTTKKTGTDFNIPAYDARIYIEQ